MRFILILLAIPAGLLGLICLATVFTKGGSDIQLIAFGVFLVAVAVAVAGIGIMARLEQIRDKEQRS